MKFAFFNPTAIAIDEIPDDIFIKLRTIVNTAHTMSQYNDAGDPSISIRGGQQIQLLPNDFGLDTSELKTYVEGKCQEYINSVMEQSAKTDLDFVKPKLISAWTIKQNPGDYQAIHAHEAHISGNIFIEVPNLEPNSKPTDAHLELRLPIMRDLSKFVLVDQCRVAPVQKTMVIFPSYVPHTVYPWKGTGTRIVLAWDAIMVPKEEQQNLN